MSSSRRDFIQKTATAAAAVSLGPLGSSALAEIGAPAAAAPRNERVRARLVPLDQVRLTGGPLKKAQDSAAKTTGTNTTTARPDPVATKKP